jgi:hypothetical protein
VPSPSPLGQRQDDLVSCLPTGLDGAHLAAASTPQRPASVKRPGRGTGLSTCCPSPTLFSYGLGPTNPPRITRAAEPLGFRRWGFVPHFSVTHSGIRTRGQSTGACAPTSSQPRRSPTTRARHESCASARSFAPLKLRRGATRPVSCYALFQGWLLLSQPPGCLRGTTAFSTEDRLGGLSGRSGLFPSRQWMFAPTVSLAVHAYWHSEFAVAW